MIDNPNPVEPKLFQSETIMIANGVSMSRTVLFLLEFKGQDQIYFKYVKQLRTQNLIFFFIFDEDS